MEELSLLRAAGAVVSLGVSNPGTDPGLELLFSHLRSLGGSVLRSFGEVDILQQRWPWGSSACTPLPPPPVAQPLARGSQEDVGSARGGNCACCLMVLASPSPEAFPDGVEVFGSLDSKDNTGEQEEGTPCQAEPEGILEQGTWG